MAVIIELSAMLAVVCSYYVLLPYRVKIASSALSAIHAPPLLFLPSQVILPSLLFALNLHSPQFVCPALILALLLLYAALLFSQLLVIHDNLYPINLTVI